MPEEQVKAAGADAAKEEEEEEVEEISEDELEGVAGGIIDRPPLEPTISGITCCGHDPCLGPLAGCNSETTAD